MGKSLGLLAAALLTGVPGAASAQDEFEFTGKWTVVYPVYPKEHDGLRQAALYAGGVTFADVMKEALGLRIGIYSEDKVPADAGHRVYIGGKFAEQAGLMPADFRGWDYGMAEKDGDLYFFGHDQPGAHPRHDSGCVNPSVLAVARFLQERVGVLFLMPGRIGREVPKLERLMLPKGFFGRGTLRFEYNGGRGGDYLHYLANGMGGHGRFHTYGGHTYTAACPRDKYLETNPEFFAKDANGKPIRGGSNGCQAYCISNPVFRKMVYEEMLRRYDAGALSCQLGQNDGAAGLCKCKACFDLYGTGDDWSEKIWLYHREIAERLLKDRPGKIVHIICYGDTAKPPKTFKVFPENVMIENCKYDEEAIRQWDGYTVPQGFTYYLYNWGWYQLLGLTPHRSVAGLVDQVKRLHSRGLKGIYRCGYGELFGMEGPVYWVFDHLLVDPTLDPKALLATYYRGAFGPAAAPMKRFYEDLEEPLSRVEKRNSTEASDLVESTIRRTRERDPVSALAVVYTPERVRRMDAALEAAETTKGLSEKQVRRLRLVRAEWTYVRNVGSIAYLYEQFRIRPTKDLCRRIMSLVKERNAILDRYIENGRVRNIKGWEQLTFLGNPPLDQFRENGRLGAPIKEPLNWDIGRMEKYGLLPTVLMTPAERAKEMKGLRPITGFKPAGTFDGGAFFEPYEDGTGFRFGQGTNRYVRVSVRVGKEQGLEPGRTYRVTWLTRWEHVKSDRPWKGYSFLAMKGPWGPNDLNKVKMPESSAYAGTSAGWVRESVLLPVCDKPGFSSEFSFRFWEGSDGIAEVRDVTVEEVL